MTLRLVPNDQNSPDENMTLDNFEEFVPYKILIRGEDYLAMNAVQTLKKINEDTWIANVIGTEKYKVEISIDEKNDQKITHWNCSCPYDYGPICKHVVATLISLDELINLSDDYEVSDDDFFDSNTDSVSKPEKTDAQEIINQLSAEELRTFITDSLETVDRFPERFWIYFSDHIPGDPASKMREIIRLNADMAKDIYDSIDYHSTSTVTDPMFEMVEQAKNLFEKNDLEQSSEICKVIIEETPELILAMYESDGGTDYVTSFSVELLSQIGQKADYSLKKELLRWSLSEYNKTKYHDIGMDSELLNLIPHFISDQADENIFFKFIDSEIEKQQSGNVDSQYGIQKYLQEKANYLSKKNRTKELKEFLFTHRKYPVFRENLIDMFIAEEDFNNALELCWEEIKRDDKSPPNTKWQEKLLQISEAVSDLEEMRKWTEFLFYQKRETVEWYHRFKALYSDEEWAAKYEEIVSTLSDGLNNQHQGYYYKLADVFMEEKKSTELLTLLHSRPIFLNVLDNYTNVLKEDYPADLLHLYKQILLSKATQTGRGNYRELVHWFKKMEKIEGGKAVVKSLVQNLLQRYSNRRAMKEEFQKAYPIWAGRK